MAIKSSVSSRCVRFFGLTWVLNERFVSDSYRLKNSNVIELAIIWMNETVVLRVDFRKDASRHCNWFRLFEMNGAWRDVNGPRMAFDGTTRCVEIGAPAEQVNNRVHGLSRKGDITSIRKA